MIKRENFRPGLVLYIGEGFARKRPNLKLQIKIRVIKLKKKRGCEICAGQVDKGELTVVSFWGNGVRRIYRCLDCYDKMGIVGAVSDIFEMVNHKGNDADWKRWAGNRPTKTDTSYIMQ